VPLKHFFPSLTLTTIMSSLEDKPLGYPFASIDEVSAHVLQDSKYLHGDSGLHNAARSIEKTALELCQDRHSGRIEFRIEKEGGIFIDTLDDKAHECLLQSFERHKKIISLDAKEIIEKILKNYQKEKQKCQSTKI
jgi:hypothetical protein